MTETFYKSCEEYQINSNTFDIKAIQKVHLYMLSVVWDFSKNMLKEKYTDESMSTLKVLIHQEADKKE